MYENQENQPPSRGCGVDVPQGGQRGGALKSKRGASLLKIPQVNSRGARILQLSNSNTPSLAKRRKINPNGTISPPKQVPVELPHGVFTSPVSQSVESKPMDLRSPQAARVKLKLPLGMFTSPACQSVESKPMDLRSPQVRVRLKLFKDSNPSQPAPGRKGETFVERLYLNDNGTELLERHQQHDQPPSPAPESILSSSIEQPLQVQDHAFLVGTVPGVHFLVVRGTERLAEKDISNYYFISPEYYPICLRTTLSISMQDVWRYVKQRMSLVMESPIISFKGIKVPLSNTLEDYQKNSTFTIHDDSAPQENFLHLGKLWQCLSCQNPGYDAKKSFKGKRKKCVNGHAHRFYCQNNIPKSWGHIVGRKPTKPWGCPPGIRGPKPEQDQDYCHQPPRVSTGVKLTSQSGSGSVSQDIFIPFALLR